MRRFTSAVAIGSLLLAAACATVQPAVDLPAAEAEALRSETETQQNAALARLQEHETRVATMGHRLALANTELCPRRGPLQGFSVFQTAQLPRELRPAARRYYGVSNAVSVWTVVPGSAAEKAGLKPGDTLLGINGQPVRSWGVTDAQADRRRATSREVDRVEDQLERAFDRGTVRLQIDRKGARQEIAVQGEIGCDYEVLLLPSDDVNAAADGERVAVTTGMARYTQNDEELALVLGHELAHNAMRHKERLAASTRLARVGGLLGSILIGAATGVSVDLYSLAARGTKQTRLTMERESDYVGMYFAARAGYDVSKAQSFWRRLGADYPTSTYTRYSHPGSPERALNITATAQEIASKKASQLALRPTPAKLEQLEKATQTAVAAEDNPNTVKAAN